RDSVLLFDARRPASLVQVLDRAANDTELLADLAERSQRQARTVAGPREAARRVLNVFQDALHSVRRFTDGLQGTYPDGWTTERLVLPSAGNSQRRTLRLTLQAPDWLPWSYQRVRLLRTANVAGKTYKLKRGKTLTIERILPAEGGILEFV